ncbi:gibberellin 2-beta-dioxygenase 8 isoform X1 [Rhododendron vialii]|uniref:gibberellin 2-beta-dioxygenase 8 isoform X1 n=2 Tax=Rhododendron vialii TaxID=182163 RepID=UPI00265F45C8|nr:gibberellin 2-beta-dioxygenase 8 isoform X1 [Rhododendron vialii]
MANCSSITIVTKQTSSSSKMQDLHGLKLQHWCSEVMVESNSISVHHQNQPSNMESPEPPFQETYKSLLDETKPAPDNDVVGTIEERELPLIDLSRLNSGEEEREDCKREIAAASKEWGFFQVVNHGISRDILEQMRREQAKAFKRPFREKVNDEGLNFSAGCYRWGTPSPTCLGQLSWSEAFHVPLADVSGLDGLTSTLISSTMEQFARTASDLAQKLAEILAEKIGHKSTFFKEHCLPSTCYLRLNRYPPCPISPEVFGLMPHTDSDFLTILHQDEIGGLQLVKDGKWIAVKPNQEALIINIGDLFQAWSNGDYRSVEHRVMTNKLVERFSTAYFLCPSYDTLIQSCVEPSVYRRFSFGEFRKQVQEDVRRFGHKIGLPRFLV